MQGILVKAQNPGRRWLTATGVYRPIAEKVESRRGESGRARRERRPAPAPMKTARALRHDGLFTGIDRSNR
jgi:hypothetical protein